MCAIGLFVYHWSVCVPLVCVCAIGALVCVCAIGLFVCHWSVCVPLVCVCATGLCAGNPNNDTHTLLGVSFKRQGTWLGTALLAFVHFIGREATIFHGKGSGRHKITGCLYHTPKEHAISSLPLSTGGGGKTMSISGVGGVYYQNDENAGNNARGIK